MSFLGMDVDQVRTHAAAVRSAQQRADDLLQALSARVAGSTEHWIGPDGEEFRSQWQATVEASGRYLIAELLRDADELDQHAQEQEVASDTGDGGGHNPAQGAPGDGARARGPRYEGGPGSGEASPEVAAAWEQMDPDDQEAVLQEIADQELERYGHPGLTIYVDDIDSLGKWVSWDLFRGEHIVIDEAHIEDPDSLNTIAHEARHAAQGNWVDETAPTGFWFWRDENKDAEYAAIEEEHGVTREDIEAFRENDKNYVEPPDYPGDDAPQAELDQYHEDFDAYEQQALEADAFAAGDDFAEQITLEELQQYQEDAGVPVTG